MKTRTVKLKELVQSESALVRIAAMPLSARMSFTLSEVVREISPSLENFRKAHTALIKKYRKPAVDGQEEQPPRFTDENSELLNREYEDLLESTCQLTFGKIKLSSLLSEKVGSHKEGDKTIDDFLKLSGIELHQLAWLVRVDNAETLFENEE